MQSEFKAEWSALPESTPLPTIRIAEVRARIPPRGYGNTSTPGGYGIVSKLSLFMTQYATMRLIGVRRRAQMTPARLDGG